jgi:hypothetical protein
MPRRTLATMLVLLLASIPLPGQTASLGVITQSTGGRLNNAAASAGTTIYDGDRLVTDSNGTVSLRSGSVQLVLSQDSALLLNHDGSGLTPMLQRGSVAFRIEGGQALRLSAGDVRVRPQSSALTVGQLTLENCAVLVTSRVQALEVTAGKETKIVEEGKSYRVLFDGACGNRSNHSPNAAAHSRFILVPLVVGGAITVWGIHEALESPDRP